MNDGLKCDNAWLSNKNMIKTVYCKFNGNLCSYQFFCPNYGTYINSDGCSKCKNFIEMEV
jgi:hypothetical protein